MATMARVGFARLWVSRGTRGRRSWERLTVGHGIVEGALVGNKGVYGLWVCLLLKWNGKELAQLNVGRGARVRSRWLGRNARRREAQRGGACRLRRRVGAASFEEGGDSVKFQRG